MTRCALALAFAGLAGAAAPQSPAADIEIPPPADTAALAAAPTFGPDEPVVATHYFYWYRWPDEHFFDDAARTDSALRQHFPDDRAVSYESVAWHRRQMEDLLAAGIDVALCIYWGAPNQYDHPDLRFSVAGLPPLVAALDQLAARGRAPRIGLFYDTSTLMGRYAFRPPRDTPVDLRTGEGRDIFYRTIRDFFCLVPPRHWACLDGRPLVQLYDAGFAAGHDQATIDHVYTQFAQDFAGRRPFIVAGPSWSFTADARTGWGAALNGPILGSGAVQIGPGYDDSPVPGRTTPTRDRLGGGFYSASWLLALQARPRLVILETWSELHEGTGLCETLEDGRFYIDLTRRYSDLLRAGRSPEVAEWAAAVRALLAAQPSSRAGREFASRRAVGLHVDDAGRLVEEGLRLCTGVGDGASALAEAGGAPSLVTRPGAGRYRYLYFDIADPYYHDHRGELSVTVTYLDAGTAPIAVQYDSAGAGETLAECYREHPERLPRADSGAWLTATLRLPGARCANRQNAGADFRLTSPGADLAIRRIEVSKLPADYGR